MTFQEAKKKFPELTETIMYYQIIRKTSPYNKNIKWYCETFGANNNIISSFGYRTEREARASVKSQSSELFWIGNKPVWITYKEKQEG